MRIPLPAALLCACSVPLAAVGAAGACSEADIASCREPHEEREESGLLQLPRASRARPDCPSDPHSEERDTFIFGYGSLLDRTSVIKTECRLHSIPDSILGGMLDFVNLSAAAAKCVNETREKRQYIPVRIKGIQRGWYAPGTLQGEKLGMSTNGLAQQALDLQPTYLGAVKSSSPSSHITGVLYQVTPEQLEETDVRECGPTGAGYSKEWAPLEDIEVLTGSMPLGCARVRWYASSESSVREPSRQHPIVQSYVDLVFGGALQIGQEHDLPDFAMQTLLTTKGWSCYWVNDRILPYRSFAANNRAGNITTLLENATMQPGSPLTMDILNGAKLAPASGLPIPVRPLR